MTVCLNVRDALEHTLKSVLAQTYGNIEYIIVDGASTDGTLEMLAPYRDRIARLVSEPDGGISDAFSKGIGLATGEIVGILNAGDTYMPETVEASARALADRTYGFSFGDCVFVEPDGRRFTMLGDPRYESSIRRRMPLLNHPTVFVRRSVYQAHGAFQAEWRLAMDYELLLRFHVRGVRGVYIPRLLAEMPRDGVSQRRYIGSIREMRDISVAYGYPRALAYPYFAFNALKYGVRRGLERLGLLALLGFLRGRLHSRYRES